MSENINRQEVLIMTNTSFSSRSLTGLEDEASRKPFSRRDQLIEACWNGLTPELLPECFDQSALRHLRLWGINDARCFIDLDFGTKMAAKDKHHSVNPYAFMQVQELN